MASEPTARRIFTALIVLSLALLALVIRPFAEALFLAAVLAAALRRPQVWLAGKLRGREGLAAAILTVAVIVAILLPISGFTAFGVTQIADGVQFVRETVQTEGVDGLVDRLPKVLQGPLDALLARLEADDGALGEVLERQVSERGGAAATWVRDVLTTTGQIALHSALMLIALYFFLVDGDKLVAWLERTSPLRQGQTQEILREFRRVSLAVLYSSLATAGVQALAALAGYLIVGVPAPIFFTGVTFFVALIPAIGGAFVVVATAALMFLSGHPWAALFLVIYGPLVVGLADNVTKPLLTRRGLHLHAAIIFFALLGGLAAFGAVGLLLGPLIVAFFLALLRIHERDYGQADGDGRPGAAPPTPPVDPPPAP